MFKWFNFLPLGLFTLEQLLTQYGLSGQMSLGHTFSSALHYTGPLTSSGTPIKAIQAKSCVSLWLFLFLPRRIWDLLQSISTSFSFCLLFDTSWNLFFFTWIIGLRHTSELQKTHSGFIHWANFGANCLKTQESLTLSAGLVEVHGLKDYPVLGHLPRCIMVSFVIHIQTMSCR